ncbi:MAG: hypothetical protein M3292_04670 [Actinomycetota bacterium]|nr:hypothetical protein [Actinomycetota bacterium]
MSVAARLLLALAVGLPLTVAAAGCGNSSEEARKTTTATTAPAETGTRAGAAPGAKTSGEKKAEGKQASAASGETAKKAKARPQGVSASRARRRIVRPVDRVLFRIPRNEVVCGRKRSALVCWRPVSGFTVRLGRGDSPPTQGFIAANRGLPPAVRSVPVLRRGRPLRSGAFACVLRATNTVRCRNGARHGFELGKLVSFRY